ncbi:MAG: hypothetical protein K2X11_13135 [Acetobacteraceae bacterium]|nr:hypothetical protein [Acetobacteraceae bacterium]
MRSIGFGSRPLSVLASFRTDAPLKAHPRYLDAKAGDAEAAAALVRDLAGSLAADAARAFGDQVLYAAPTAREARGDNAIPDILATALAANAGAEADTVITQVSRAYHTGANAMERLIAPALFAGTVRRGQAYVLTDDVMTLGGTLAEMADHIHRGGGSVVGVAVLVDASRGGVLFPSSRVTQQLERRLGDEIRGTLRIQPAALTAEEAQYLLGFRTADELRNRAAKAEEERLHRLRAKGVF